VCRPPMKWSTIAECLRNTALGIGRKRRVRCKRVWRRSLIEASSSTGVLPGLSAYIPPVNEMCRVYCIVDAK
jgi:hypothetical protein